MTSSPLRQLVLVRYREFFREPEAVFWVFVFPVLLTAGLGIAFRNQAPPDTAVAVVGGTPSTDSARVVLQAGDGITVESLTDSAANEALRAGRVSLVVAPGPGGTVEYRYDKERPEGRTARLQVDAAVQAAAGRSNPVTTSDRLVSEPGARYVDFVVPGLLGMNLMGSGIWGLGFAIVDSRRKKLLKRLIATPMSRTQYLASFVLSRLTLLTIEVGVLLGFAAFVFGVPMRGSILVLGAVCVLSALAFSALGLLIASRAQTVEGVSGLMNLVMLPMWILSGTFFSYARFPEAMLPFVRALPLTALNDSLRGVMIEGASLISLAPALAIVTIWGAASFVIALRIFRWR